MKFRGGEFSTGTMGNFQPELTCETARPDIHECAEDPSGPGNS
jgi:hypothetical protein